MSAMLDFAEYHNWISVSRNLQKSGFLPVCQPVFCKFLERMAPVTPARFTFGYGLGHNIIWIYACDQSRKYVNHVMLWLCYITVPWEFPGGSPRRFPESRGNSYYLHSYVFTFVVIHDQLYYKGAMLGSSTPSITLSISAKSCMTSSKAISAHPSRSSCERD